MIYLRKGDVTTTVWIPKTVKTAEMLYTMTFHSTVGLEDFAINVQDMGTVDGYLILNIAGSAIDELTPGEWEYRICTDGCGTGCTLTVATGVAKVLDADIQYDEYEINVNYEQYRQDE